MIPARAAHVRCARVRGRRAHTSHAACAAATLAACRVHRAQPMQSVPGIRSRLYGINVPPVERALCVALGGALALLGMRRRTGSGVVLALVGGGLAARGLTGRCPLYRLRAVKKGITVRRAVTVQASPREIYDLWRDLRNLPRFLSHVTSVELEDNGVSRWTIEEGPVKLSWRAEIIEDTPARRLRWRAIDGALHHEGALELREGPTGRGTVVELKLHVRPEGGSFAFGVLSGLLRKLAGLGLDDELARMRAIIETGEPITAARNPAEAELPAYAGGA